jgi:hypothetical protein
MQFISGNVTKRRMLVGLPDWRDENFRGNYLVFVFVVMFANRIIFLKVAYFL